MIGAQFISIGLLGEMIAAYLVRDADTYSIAEHTPPGRHVARHALGQDQRHAMTDRMPEDPIRCASAGASIWC